MAGKVAVITGGSGGLGNAIAKAMTQAGATVIATSRKGNPLNGDTPLEPGQITEVALDVTDETQVNALFSRLESNNQSIDVLVNSAGLGLFKPGRETTGEEFRRVLDTNVLGTFLCSKAAAKSMARHGGGRIINIGSVAAHTAVPSSEAYVASKFAVRGLSLGMNETESDSGVFTSVVHPGAVDTELWNGVDWADPSRMLRPKQVADAVLFIASRKPDHRIPELRIEPAGGLV